MSTDQIISEIHSLSQSLVKERDQWQSKCVRLEEEMDALRSKMIQQQEMLAQLEEQNQTLKIAKSLTDAEDHSEAKMKINELVREIDKCIALLNT